MSDFIIPVRECHICHEIFPRSPEHWHKNKRIKDGLCTTCKECAKAKTQKWAKDNPERDKAGHRRYYVEHEQEIIQKAKDWAAIHVEHRKQYLANYYIENKEWFQDEGKKWRKSNPEVVKAAAARWLAKNPDRRREISNKWGKTDKARVGRHNYRARRKSLPNTFILDEWLACIAYWENKCAYCGKEMDRFDADHFIPLNSIGCPGTIVQNMICACDACNSSKQDTDPYRWVQSKFPTTFGGILYRIEAYFDSLDSRAE